ncbi:Fpg/Nei family DNA glycosylase [Sinomonas mesophila]|uniref:Fpg/Nei family DNA glycosylase n=1 Tax=Sinomonas mesophila TaxID=1531955 RepID=UPI0009876FF1|nr:DNA-formamidopyrimidine glycosylase family protein [Sinomonas mesophila]
MPELPEVTALAAFLDRRLAGARVESVSFGSVHALKTADPPYSALIGRTVESVARRGKFVVVDTVPTDGPAADDGAPRLAVVVHLALGGWVRLLDHLPTAASARGKGYIAARFGFVRGEGEAREETGLDLTEAGTWKRLSVHIVRAPEEVPGIAALGPEPLAEGFSLEDFRAILGHRQQIKGLLRDQKIIAGIGNAYSDEILHAAKISPFALASTLDDDTTARLYAAMREVLAEAVEHAAGLPPEELKDEKRASMRVHRRTGEPCPVCGDTILEVSFADSALQYCPTCQTGGKPLADRRTSKFLK